MSDVPSREHEESKRIPVPRPSPGNNSELPNRAPAESEDLPDEISRDVTNAGEMADPADRPIP